MKSVTRLGVSKLLGGGRGLAVPLAPTPLMLPMYPSQQTTECVGLLLEDVTYTGRPSCVGRRTKRIVIAKSIDDCSACNWQPVSSYNVIAYNLPSASHTHRGTLTKSSSDLLLWPRPITITMTKNAGTRQHGTRMLSMLVGGVA